MTLHVRHALAPALCMMALAPLAIAQAPRRLSDVPLSPAARADTTAALGYGEPPCWSEECRTYLVPAAIEEVFRFYQQRLAARSSGEADVDAARDAALERVSRAGTTPVFYQTRTWSEALRSAPPAARQGWESRLGVVRRRAPYRPNEWLAWVRFAWGARTPDGEAYLSVTLHDAPDPRAGQQTRLQIEFAPPEGDAAEEPPEEPSEPS